MDTTLQKSYYCFLEGFIKEHWNLLQESRVFVFGAGIRGSNLVLLLRSFQIEDVFFVDNSIQKQGKYIAGCKVLSFEEAKKYSGKHIFLCPIENGKSILEQLEETGRKENVDFFNLDFYFTDYLDIINELSNIEGDFSLAFGCCILSSYILGEKRLPSLGKQMQKELFGESCIICALPGFSPENYYYVLRMCMLQQKMPEFVIMALDYSSLSPYNNMMIGKQNQEQITSFVEKMAELVPENEEIQQFLELNHKRLEKSMHGGKLVSAEDSKEAIRKVYKLKYLFNMKEQDDSVVYTKKILEMMNEANIPVYLQFLPVDYMRGMEICGEGFRKQYESIKNQYLSFLKEYRYEIIDSSFIAPQDCFVLPTEKPDIDPFLNEKGQRILLQFMKDKVKEG